MNGSERGKLKNGVSKTEQNKGEPDALEARDAPEAIAQRLPHRIEKHYDRIPAAKPEQRIRARQTGKHVVTA
ncbi:MAG TPA: hypothetical protein DCO65_05215 [Spartobacteria bacterium]|nr:hypothetical protein [Spartobacteria bacterium]